MGCGGSKGVNSADVVLVQTPSSLKRVSAVRGGQQDDDIKLARRSIHYMAKEMEDAPPLSQRTSAQFELSRIGTHTLHGIMPGPKGTGKSKINQDRGAVVWPFCGSYNEALFAIFDGHGPKGERASQFCMTRLPELLEASHDDLLADAAACLKSSFVKLDEELRTTSEHHRYMDRAGTTATVLYMRGDDLYTAWAGDSRAVRADVAAGRASKPVAADLTVDHKPELASERERIEACGGEVKRASKHGTLRVWNKGAVGLGVTRSIGDDDVKSVGVTAEPEVVHSTLHPAARGAPGAPSKPAGGAAFVIIASDGVWEFISSQEAVDTVAQAPDDATQGCETLVALAKERWRENESVNRDDITAIVCHLPFLEDDLPVEVPSPNGAAAGDEGGGGDGGAGGGTAADAASPDVASQAASGGRAPSMRERLSASARSSAALSPSEPLFINSGEEGIVPLPDRTSSFEAAAPPAQPQRHAGAPPAAPTASTGMAGSQPEEMDDVEEGVIRRRFTVYDPHGEDGGNDLALLSRGQGCEGVAQERNGSSSERVSSPNTL